MAKNLQGLSAQELTSLILKKGRREIERYFHTYRALSDKFGRELKTAPREDTESFSELIKDELELLRPKPSPQYELIRRLEERRFWKKRYNVNELKARWVRMCTELLEPLVITKYIEEIVRIWPPMVPERALTQPFLTEARYVGEELAFNDRLYHLQTPSRAKRIKKAPQLDEVRRFMVDNFREVVSVLVYDIRGSTFMGNRLNNARKESEIRNNFNICMMQIARRHGAFVVKDTGDGGILFFSGNSRELERKCLESGNRSHPGDNGLVPSRESARKAIECARDMVKGAFNFVEDNLEQYGDWFEDVRKESLRYAGISYAQLPPEYKRIFKVGIGIASGRPDVDIYFGQNGFGSPDITGGLVREANFYSKARSKERSIILCDGTTLLSFLLNVDQYEPQGTLPVRTRSPAGESLSELLLDAMWNYAKLKEQKSGYKFGKLGVFIERVGAQIYYEKELESTFSLTCSGLDITSSGEFLDERNRKVKILYQIIPEWMKG
jgi:class 3 adenylate cyclase